MCGCVNFQNMKRENFTEFHIWMLLYVFLLKDFGKLIIVLLRWLFSVDDFLAIYPESFFFSF